jgi:hypothetical protein
LRHGPPKNSRTNAIRSPLAEKAGWESDCEPVGPVTRRALVPSGLIVLIAPAAKAIRPFSPGNAPRARSMGAVAATATTKKGVQRARREMSAEPRFIASIVNTATLAFDPP